MGLDPKVWGPHYWFVLHTMALSYPLHPNETIKKKYYDFINNLPLFLPIQSIGNKFAEVLDSYPVSPYLDSRESFIKWVHFIHNKINISLNIPEKSYDESLNDYYEYYKPKEVIMKENIIKKEKYVYCSLIILLIISAFFLYKKI